MTKQELTHYVLIDNFSGYVWGEADAASVIDACRIVDEQIGGEPREYEEQRISGSDMSGYLVYEAPTGWTEVQDGRSESEIERVQALCSKVTEVTFTEEAR